jgi:hypothetical protein
MRSEDQGEDRQPAEGQHKQSWSPAQGLIVAQDEQGGTGASKEGSTWLANVRAVTSSPAYREKMSRAIKASWAV